MHKMVLIHCSCMVFVVFVVFVYEWYAIPRVCRFLPRPPSRSRWRSAWHALMQRSCAPFKETARTLCRSCALTASLPESRSWCCRCVVCGEKGGGGRGMCVFLNILACKCYTHLCMCTYIYVCVLLANTQKGCESNILNSLSWCCRCGVSGEGGGKGGKCVCVFLTYLHVHAKHKYVFKCMHIHRKAVNLAFYMSFGVCVRTRSSNIMPPARVSVAAYNIKGWGHQSTQLCHV